MHNSASLLPPGMKGEFDTSLEKRPSAQACEDESQVFQQWTSSSPISSHVLICFCRPFLGGRVTVYEQAGTVCNAKPLELLTMFAYCCMMHHMQYATVFGSIGRDRLLL